MIRNGVHRNNPTLPGSRLAGLALIASIMFLASSAAAQISLGTAAAYGVLAGSTVTNTGATIVSGNLGVSPGTAVTGFPPGVVVPPGVIHSADASAAQAQADLTTAYNAVAGTATLVDLTGTDLGGLTLTPGVYGFSSSAQLTGTLTLDAQGNPNALFLFKIGTSLTTASGSSVAVINGGSGCNAYWQIGSSATLGTGTSFLGNILALASITMNTGASLGGRALARNGAVTLEGNAVTVCPTAPVVCPTITVNPATLPPAVTGTPYSQLITASGGTGPYTYAVSSGVVPPGLTLNPATGALTGTPTTFGTYNFTITGTDANACPGSRAYVIIVSAPACPAISMLPIALPSAQIGSPWSQVITASGGTGPYTYAVTSGTLPGGLSLNSASGVMAGAPTTAGTFTFTITATDSNNCPGSRLYVMVIPAVVCPVITMTPASLLAPVLGVPYSQTISASGGAAPYSFAITSGALPAGLVLNGTTGTIAGTPSLPGSYSFTVTATSANGCLAAISYSQVVVPIVVAPPPPPDPIPTLSEWGLIMLIAMMALLGSRGVIRRR